MILYTLYMISPPIIRISNPRNVYLSTRKILLIQSFIRLREQRDIQRINCVVFTRHSICFVVIELKTHKITHEDIGQLQMYVNYYDRNEKAPDENPTIGILLCADKNDLLVKYTLPENNNTILASKYQLYLPTEKQLAEQLRIELQEFDQ